MKRIIIAVLAVTAAAVTAQAQGVARDFNTFAQNAPTVTLTKADSVQTSEALAKKTAAAAAKIEREVQRQRIAHLRAEEAKKQAAASAQAAGPATTADKQEGAQVPSYYYGREGKMLALGDKMAETVSDNSKSAQPAQTKTSANQTKKTKEKVSFWRYILPGPLPNESWSEYSKRMSYAGSQPFK